jgi:hypothetical protein
MSKPRRIVFYWVIGVFVIALISIPYIYAYLIGGDTYVFQGFLLNPLDGNSYYAKMRQGLSGTWTFTLPYTAEPGEGTYLFLFYLGLGHLARIMGLDISCVYHLTRLVSAGFLLFSMKVFFMQVLTEEWQQRLAFALSALGGGLGWVVIPFTSQLPADFWVAEGFPFLSSYANPHFPLGLGLMLQLLLPGKYKINYWRVIMTLLMSLMLAISVPFGVPIVYMVLGILTVWSFLNRERWQEKLVYLIVIGVGTAPILLYYFWIANTHAVLSVWNAQNITSSPEVWDVFLSFSPALILAVLGVWYAWQSGEKKYRVICVWGVFCLILLYIPFSLQRRFITGFYIPITGLGVLGVTGLSKSKERFRRLLILGWTALIAPTILILLFASIYAVRTYDMSIFMTSSERQALAWIEENTEAGSLILAGPEVGNLVPAYTCQRVIYGHPFESVNAKENEDIVVQFYSGEFSNEQMSQLLKEWEIDYIFLGPRESILGELPILTDWQLVFNDRDVKIYDTGEE